MNFENVEEKVIYKLLSDNKDNVNNNIVLSNEDKESVYLNEINKKIILMDQKRENYAYRNLSSKSRLKTFIKKSIRKILKWYIEPICFQQTDFNNAVTPCIGRLTELHTINTEKINTLSNENQQLKDMINDIQSMFNQQIIDVNSNNTEEINTLSNENQQLKDMINNMTDKLNQLNDIQSMFNQQIIGVNSKLEKVNELDLDIFKDKSSFFDKRCTSQSGEDMIIAYVLRVLGLSFNDCTYLDLGANHAIELNNTYYLYKQGARGVLVEANPNLISELKFYRYGDVILNRCVYVNEGQEEVDFYLLNGDGLSSPSKDSLNDCLNKNKNLKLDNIVKVKTITIKDIFDQYFDKAPTVLNIDIEGKELDILKGINFENFRPLIIIIEMIPYQIDLVIENKNKEIFDFMIENNYTEYAFTGINSIFLDKSQLKR